MPVFHPEDFPGWMLGPGETEAAWEVRTSPCLSLPISAMRLKGVQGHPSPGTAWWWGEGRGGLCRLSGSDLKCMPSASHGTSV